MTADSQLFDGYYEQSRVPVINRLKIYTIVIAMLIGVVAITGLWETGWDIGQMMGWIRTDPAPLPKLPEDRFIMEVYLGEERREHLYR